METGELYFAFYPGGLQTGKQYVELADFFLEHIDHGQEQAVNLAYEFYKLSKADYFVLSSFLPFLEKEMAALKQTGRGKEHGWCVSGGVHGKAVDETAEREIRRLEPQEYRWGAHNAAGWRMACRAAKK